MKVHVYDCRVGLPRPYPQKRTRHVVIAFRVEECSSMVTIALTEANARDLHKWLGRDLDDLDRGFVEGFDGGRFEIEAKEGAE